MPTDVLLDLSRPRRDLKWGIPQMLLAVPYLLVLLFIWNAMTFALMGPLSLVLLVRARIQEAAARNRERGSVR